MRLVRTIAALATSAPALAHAGEAKVDKGDAAWLMVATLLVVLMIVPGLALFYGGLVRAKNVLSMLVQVLAVASLVLVLWIAYGYSLAFDGGGALIGGLGKTMLRGVGPDSIAPTFTDGVGVPELLYVAFQGAFAAISAALVVGGVAERARISALLAFAALWFTFAYLPLAHMVWSPNGWLFGHGALDFAGGTVVHINAGIAGLVAARRLGPRLGYGRERLSPHSLPLAMAGAALLWVGWFGFNAGSALEANGTAALAFLNTLVAGAAGVLAWCAIEAARRGHASMLGAASGLVSALVAITPACGTVGVGGALLIGAAGGLAGFWGVGALKHRLRIDDTLDVFGIHGVCGIVGALLTAVFSAPVLGGAMGADYSMARQLGVQAVGIVATLLLSGLVTAASLALLARVMPLRLEADDEREGLDIATHGESAYAP